MAALFLLMANLACASFVSRIRRGLKQATQQLVTILLVFLSKVSGMYRIITLDGDHEYYLAIGRSTAAWASVEFILDGVTAVAFKRFAGDQLEDCVPQNYNRKVRLIRKAFQANSDATPFVAELLPLLDRSVALNKMRKLMAHGTAMNTAAGTLSFRLFEYGKSGHKAVRHDIDAVAFLAHADACLELADDLFRFVGKLVLFLGGTNPADGYVQQG